MARKPSAVAGARVVGEQYLRMKRRENPEGRMPLLEHLAELRNRLLKAAITLILGMIIAIVYSNQTWHLVTRPFCEAVIRGHTGCTQAGDQLVVNGVFEGFFIRVKIAFFIGLIGSSPVWLYQLWAFIAPGLYSREKKWAYIFTGTAVPLFLGGAVLAYLVMDKGLHYLLGLTPAGVLNLPSVDTYLSYFVGMVVGFGIAFELPLVMIMLNLVGILTHERFRRWRKMLIFIVFLIAGIANPSPDPWTMLILGGMCVVLVEVAEVFIYFNDKRRARRNPSPYADLSDNEAAPLDDPEPVDADNSAN
jgi:sec-independent protein translocase protein TatC